MTWIFKWKVNGFRNAQGEAVKNAGIIRCISIQLDIRARYGQKIRLQYIKGHSGDIGNDGADAMANRGTLLPAVKERDWEALEMELSEQLERSSVETRGIEPIPVEVEDTGDESTAVKMPSPKLQKTSSGISEHKGRTTMALAASSPFKSASYSTATVRTSSGSTSNPLPGPSAPPDEKNAVVALPAQSSVIPVPAQPQNTPLESSATVCLENIRDKKVSLKVICALPPFVPVKYEAVDFNVRGFFFYPLT